MGIFVALGGVLVPDNNEVNRGLVLLGVGPVTTLLGICPNGKFAQIIVISK